MPKSSLLRESSFQTFPWFAGGRPSPQTIFRFGESNPWSRTAFCQSVCFWLWGQPSSVHWSPATYWTPCRNQPWLTQKHLSTSVQNVTPSLRLSVGGPSAFSVRLLPQVAGIAPQVVSVLVRTLVWSGWALDYSFWALGIAMRSWAIEKQCHLCHSGPLGTIRPAPGTRPVDFCSSGGSLEGPWSVGHSRSVLAGAPAAVRRPRGSVWGDQKSLGSIGPKMHSLDLASSAALAPSETSWGYSPHSLSSADCWWVRSQASDSTRCQAS